MTWLYTENYLQQSHQTKENRFPKIFESIKLLKPDAKRILSFGCSSGEECATLAKLYPTAEIVGVDIDYYTIQKARKNNKCNRVFFHTDLGGTGTYDLVTCFMVLFSMDSPIDHTRWDEILTHITNHVNTDGLLAIYTSEYDFFLLATCAGEYDVIRQWARIHDKNKKEYYCGYYRKKAAKFYSECG